MSDRGAINNIYACILVNTLTMVGGVISDLYHAEERNTPMTLFSGAVLFATGLGPLVSGFVEVNSSTSASGMNLGCTR